MSLAYLAVLLASLGGLGVLDWRFRLVFFANPLRATLVLAAGLALFILWDLAGIGSGIFLAGDSQFATGVFVLPQFPLEELFFLLLLVYLPLITWQGVSRWRRIT